jgi:hypothetical protein
MAQSDRHLWWHLLSTRRILSKPQTNGSWSGVWMLNEVVNGSFDEMPISINYLKEVYGTNNTRSSRKTKAA